MEANRDCSVCGNGIKLYSNYVLSISREQHSRCGCEVPLRATWIAKATCYSKATRIAKLPTMPRATGNIQRPKIAKSKRELLKAT
jgi:hypothetical protein